METPETHVVADRLMREMQPAFFNWFWASERLQQASFEVIRDAWRGHVTMNFANFKS